MNGTIYDEIKKKVDSKKRDKFKFIVSLLVSNVFIAILFLNFTTSNGELKTQENSPRIIHAHHKMIIAPLIIMTAMNPQDVETEITLMSKSKKILIRRAFLHEQIVTDSNSSETRFKIEIPDDDLMKISANPEQEMIALPMLKNKIEENHLHNKRVSHYEVDL